METLGRLTETLFAETPRGLLYHYTTLSGMVGIVGSRSLWASDIRYMNDSAELRHAVDLIRLEVQERISRGQGRADLLGQFADWVAHRITTGHLLFAASFRSHGNLLSQWRGYSSHGKGVSLGFPAETILACAGRQSYQVGKCLYTPASQHRLIGQAVDAVEELAAEHLAGTESRERQAAIFQEVFAAIEVDLLRIASVIKHPSFREEQEWRIVSPVYSGADAPPILFREAHAMLVPYVTFDLQQEPGGRPRLDHVFLGPTSNSNISLNSLRMFLNQNGIVPERGIDYCQIPYRQQ